MRARFGLTLSLATLVAASLVGTSAAADPVSLAGGSSTARANTPGSVKVPWGSGVARFVPGHVVVVWKDGAPRKATRALNASLGARTIAPMAGLNVDVVRVDSGTSVSATIRRYQRSPLVRFAEPDRIATVAAPITNDPLVGQQWALDNNHQLHKLTNEGFGFGDVRRGKLDADVDAPEAWSAQIMHGPAIIAVIDTGVDINQPDLKNRLWVNTAEKLGTPGVDDDGNGFVDDKNGWDFKGNDPNPTPGPNTLDDSHGTHVGGIVAAEQGNNEGISGVCPDCTIMALRIGSASSLTLGNELKAINYAIRNHADVINLSLGDPVWSKAERAAIARAGRAGILVVVAAGNSSMDNDIQFYEQPRGLPPSWAPSYPASYTLKNILAVAASNDRDQYGYVSQCQANGVPLWECGFTSWGHDSVDVAAPGVDILSTVKAHMPPLGHTYPNYEFFDGTSMAAPMVAGIAGLVRSEHPSYSAVQIKNAIMHSVNHPPSLKLYDAWGPQAGVGKKLLTGHFTRTQGRVNALRALTSSTTNATPLTDGNIDGAKLFTSPKVGHLAWPADANDVYKRKLRKGTRYQIVLNGPSGSDMDLWVWRPGTTEIFQFTSGCFVKGGACPALQAVSGGRTADEKVTFKAPKTGVFYIQVNGWYSGGRYKLTIQRV
ncbi:MAG: S8 family serine peptidase [Actinomycetota bacterium]|nr:S8 family serine peptidase [Actinomycetota bacterium]